ncbi:hypothetical protein DT23_14605 [Thioclava indica]|uniref:Hedgehog/Intein (Hint) domain-containing protein n=2 Tax=Thioclava indica TaxID=1353528 RepID=A0A074JUK4_9RHOB|nr:hypothetical protein DT23_14605 [Thioclava indica]
MTAADMQMDLTTNSTGQTPFLTSVFTEQGPDCAQMLRLEFSDHDERNGMVRGYDAQGQALFNGEIATVIAALPCFTQDARIVTEAGEVAVSDLRAGQRVVTRDNGLQELRWIGARRFGWHMLGLNPLLRPVRLAASALGRDLPETEITVSPNHRLLSSMPALGANGEQLVMARDLIGLEGVTQCACPEVTYFQLLFDHHELVLANGIWSESFRPNADNIAALSTQSRADLMAALPDAVEYAPVRPDAPLVDHKVS